MPNVTVSAKHLSILFLFSFVAVLGAQLWFPATKVDVGSGPDGYLSGFYGPEVNAGHVFRWSTEGATIRFPNVSRSSRMQLSLVASAWRYQDQVFTATVTINGSPIGEISKAGWRNWRFAVSDPAVLEGGTLVVGIHTKPIVLSELYPDSNEDNRPVGIMIDSVELAPQRTGDLLEAIVDRTTSPLDAPLVIVLILGSLSYALVRLMGVPAGWALVAAMSGAAGFAAGLALAWSAATLRVVLFVVCAGVALAVSALRPVNVEGENTARQLRSQWSDIAARFLSIEPENWVILAIGVAFAMALRYNFFGFVSGDLTNAYASGDWFAFIQKRGFSAFRENFSSYAPSYLYLLYIMSVVFPDLTGLVAVKLIAVFFDLVCAFLVWKMVRLKYADLGVSNMAFLAVLFAPTVVMNSSLWGQSDSVYTAGILAFVYLIATRRSTPALVSLSIAFAFKPQAIFMAPLLLILLVKRSVRWYEPVLIPLTYLVLTVPAWLAGGRILDLATIYISPVQHPNNVLTLHAANVYAWLPNSAYDLLVPVGFVLTAAIAALFVAMVCRSKLRLDVPVIIQLAVASALLIPFLLPWMHERYFFPADVLSIVFAFYFPRYSFVAFGTSLISFFSYSYFLFGQDFVPLQLLALGTLTLIVALAWHLMHTPR